MKHEENIIENFKNPKYRRKPKTQTTKLRKPKLQKQPKSIPPFLNVRKDDFSQINSFLTLDNQIFGKCKKSLSSSTEFKTDIFRLKKRKRRRITQHNLTDSILALSKTFLKSAKSVKFNKPYKRYVVREDIPKINYYGHFPELSKSKKLKHQPANSRLSEDCLENEDKNGLIPKLKKESISPKTSTKFIKLKQFHSKKSPNSVKIFKKKDVNSVRSSKKDLDLKSTSKIIQLKRGTLNSRISLKNVSQSKSSNTYIVNTAHISRKPANNILKEQGTSTLRKKRVRFRLPENEYSRKGSKFIRLIMKCFKKFHKIE